MAARWTVVWSDDCRFRVENLDAPWKVVFRAVSTVAVLWRAGWVDSRSPVAASALRVGLRDAKSVAIDSWTANVPPKDVAATCHPATCHPATCHPRVGRPRDLLG